MKLFGKKRKSFFGVALGCASMLYAAGDEMTQLDIVIRDFQPNHPDFENFSEEYAGTYDGYASGELDYLKERKGQYKNLYMEPGTKQNYVGYDMTWYSKASFHKSCGNKASKTGARVGQDGLPMTINTFLPTYLQATSTAAVLEYGECESPDSRFPGLVQRGFKQVTDTANVRGFVCKGGATNWANEVYYTPGMVQSHLLFDVPADGGDYDMYDGVHIQKAQDLCDNEFFHQWFADDASVNYRINTTMDIYKDGDTKYYVYDYNYNNGGYSPLDSIDPTTRQWSGYKSCVKEVQTHIPEELREELACKQFGPQSLSIFCPPYEYEYANTQVDYMKQNTYGLCQSWLTNGGPRAVQSLTGTGNSAAWDAAQNGGALGMQHLRNYAFTMMGYAKFKYRKSNQVPTPEVFQFAGDDDMWIFVDGVLAVDLGGNHLATPGSVNIKTLADNNHGCHEGEPLANYTNCQGADASGWADNTWHHLHFFYADRQSDGSNIYIRTSLAEVAPSRYGQPAVGSVTVTMDENGQQKVSMNLNTSLDEATLQKLNDPSNPSPAILVIREIDNGDGTTSKVVYAYYVTAAVQGASEGASGIQYDFAGELRDLNGNVITTGIVAADKIAFNFPYNEELFGEGRVDDNYSPELWQQFASWSTEMSKYGYKVTSVSNKGVVGPPNSLEDWAKTQFIPNTKIASFVLDDEIDRPDFTAQSNLLTQKAKDNGGKLPTDMTAELQIVLVPKDCGAGPGSCGNGGNPLDLKEDYKKAFSLSDGNMPGNASASIVGGLNGAGLCYAGGNGKKSSVESCASFSYPVSGPFRINIRVFDHLGHFVNQYQKKVEKEDLQSVFGTGSSESACVNPRYGETGAAWVTAKVYPVSQNGRLLATGPYIYQVTFVLDEYSPCVVVGEMPQNGTVPYTRQNDTYRFGYRRAKAKK